MVKLLEMSGANMREPTQSFMDFDTGIEIVLHGVVPEGFVLTTPTRQFTYSAEHDVWRAERIGDGQVFPKYNTSFRDVTEELGYKRFPANWRDGVRKVNAPVVAHHDGYLEGMTQTIHTTLVYGSISPEFDRAAEIVKHMYEDPDGPLVPLPSKLQPIERPFVPRKFGEY